MSNVYLITGASSDVGIALIRRVLQPEDVVIAHLFHQSQDYASIVLNGE